MKFLDNKIDYLHGGLVEAHSDELADQCKALLKNDEERQKVSARGFKIFSQLKQEEFLKYLVR